jgi:hypothetical protein
MSLRVAFLVLGLSVYPLASAHANPITYEGFDYKKDDSLDGKNGGTGWGNAWSSPQAAATIIEQSLADPTKTLITTGGALATSSKDQAGGVRVLKNKLGEINDQRYFLSFLLQPNGNKTDQNEAGIVIPSSGGGQSEFVLVGKPRLAGKNEYGLTTGGATPKTSFTGIAPKDGETVFLVLEEEFGKGAGGADKFSLFVNPKPGGAAPDPKTLKAQFDFPVPLINQLMLASFARANDGSVIGSAWTFDEIRLGTTYADVAPKAVPDASSSLLLLSTSVLTLLAYDYGLRRQTKTQILRKPLVETCRASGLLDP